MDARNIQNVKEREGANEMGFSPRERLFVIDMSDFVLLEHLKIEPHQTSQKTV